MNKVWDVESDKFIAVDNGSLGIKRKQQNDLSKSHNYISSFKLSLNNANKTKELMDNMAILWNNSDENVIYDMKQIVMDECNCNVKLSIFLDKEKNKYFMKFRIISKDEAGKKNIDYVKLDRQKCRELYYNIYKTTTSQGK